MDPPVKAGALLLQQPPGLRLGAKRWKKSWFVLYPASARGVARLEFFDCKQGTVAPPGADSAGTKRSDRKVVRLADCVSVALAPDGSPREGLSAFRLETSQRAFLFAAEPQDAADWVARLCEAAFPQQSPGQVTQPTGQQPWEMATNSIYFSQEEASEFWVMAQKTEAAERCGLQGRYLLKASHDGLLLADPRSGRLLYSWPYRLLRRYGRDKVMFSFEAGRRCESGPGNFTFETTQGNDIFRLVEAAIQAQKAQAEENRRSRASVDSAADGTATASQLHAAVATSLSLEGAPRTAPTATPGSAGPEGEGAAATLKGQPQRDPAGHRSGPPPPSPEETASANVYSEPLDAVRGSPPGPDPLYADPVDSRAKAGSQPRSSERQRLYEQVGPGVGGKGHIYDEPEGRAPQPAPPLSSVIYDEARLPSEAWRTQGLETPAGYELPYLSGAGDYAVPAFHQKSGIPRAPKPCPAPKPPRAHKALAQPGGAGKPKMVPKEEGPKSGGNHNNNNISGRPDGQTGAGEPLYSRVRKAPHGCCYPGEEQCVDGGRLASALYEDLGDI